MLACARHWASTRSSSAAFQRKRSRTESSTHRRRLSSRQTVDSGEAAIVPLKQAVDDAVAECPASRERSRRSSHRPAGSDEGGSRSLVARAHGNSDPTTVRQRRSTRSIRSSFCTPRGTTGKPKGIVHTTGGYLVQTYITAKWVFDLQDDDTYWCTADIGWVTGHSYMVYGPLANGATVVMYEGAPNTPDFGPLLGHHCKHKVTIFYTAPTAIRTFIKWGEHWPRKHDLSSFGFLARLASRSIPRPGCGITR